MNEKKEISVPSDNTRVYIKPQQPIKIHKANKNEQELKEYLLSNFGSTCGYSWEMSKKLRIKCISEKSEYFYEFYMKVTENMVETPEYRCIDEVM